MIAAGKLGLVGSFCAALLMVFAGCDNNNKSEDRPVQRSREVAAPADKDIVETATDAGSFTTLVSALKEADLVDTLKGPGPYTVFAPTDAAFKKLPPGTLDNLMKDKEQLKAVLLYHVVPGKVMAADVVKLHSARTVNGALVPIDATNGKVMVGKATVTQTDIVASNGVIHVIDTVLMPPAK